MGIAEILLWLIYALRADDDRNVTLLMMVLSQVACQPARTRDLCYFAEACLAQVCVQLHVNRFVSVEGGRSQSDLLSPSTTLSVRTALDHRSIVYTLSERNWRHFLLLFRSELLAMYKIQYTHTIHLHSRFFSKMTSNLRNGVKERSDRMSETSGKIVSWGYLETMNRM